MKKLILDENDDMEYILQLDNNKNYNTDIPNKKIYIKIFDYKISSINKSSPIGEFIGKYDKEYKFIIVQDINSRSEDVVESYQTLVEIFKFNKLQSDITDHDLVPQHIVLTKEEGDKVLESYRARKRDMPLIRSNDVVAKYYNMKPEEIVKIIRPSPVTGEAVAYRYVIKSKDSRVKT
jgi:DNA-directed RNA polymerase subunit H (RpoH/RPB5)